MKHMEPWKLQVSSDISHLQSCVHHSFFICRNLAFAAESQGFVAQRAKFEFQKEKVHASPVVIRYGLIFILSQPLNERWMKMSKETSAQYLVVVIVVNGESQWISEQRWWQNPNSQLIVRKLRNFGSMALAFRTSAGRGCRHMLGWQNQQFYHFSAKTFTAAPCGPQRRCRCGGVAIWRFEVGAPVRTE